MEPVLRERSLSCPVKELILSGGVGQIVPGDLRTIVGQIVPWDLRIIERAKINYFG